MKRGALYANYGICINAPEGGVPTRHPPLGTHPNGTAYTRGTASSRVLRSAGYRVWLARPDGQQSVKLA